MKCVTKSIVSSKMHPRTAIYIKKLYAAAEVIFSKIEYSRLSQQHTLRFCSINC